LAGTNQLFCVGNERSSSLFCELATSTQSNGIQRLHIEMDVVSLLRFSPHSHSFFAVKPKFKHCGPTRQTIGIDQIMVAGVTKNVDGNVLKHPLWTGIKKERLALKTGQRLAYFTRSDRVGDVAGHIRPLNKFIRQLPIFS
jgi:hypothetical protein